jgi:hypothetical protein
MQNLNNKRKGEFVSNKTKREYYLLLNYLAPENEVDTKGDPVKMRTRNMPLGPETYKKIQKQIMSGMKDIALTTTETPFSVGFEEVLYIHLDNKDLVTAQTLQIEKMTDEAVEEEIAKGKSFILNPDGSARVKVVN